MAQRNRKCEQGRGADPCILFMSRFPEPLPILHSARSVSRHSPKLSVGASVPAFLREDTMATMPELQAEYEVLRNTHRRLVEERAQLQREFADGAAFQDHRHRMRAYMTALDTYQLALAARRHEVRRNRSGTGG